MAVTGVLALAAPAAAEPVKAGPVLPDELTVLTMGGAVPLPVPAGVNGDEVALYRYATEGAYRGRLRYPSVPADGVTPLTKSTHPAVAPLRSHALKRSVDGRFVTFAANKLPFNAPIFQDYRSHVAVHVAADGTRTEIPLGYENTGNFSAVTVDGTRSWFSNSSELYTILPGETDNTRIGIGALRESTPGVEIVDGSVQFTTFSGVYRLDGGLPTTGSLSMTPARIPLIELSNAVDSAFVDTDGTAGVDTAYVSRGTRGLYKYTLAGGQWTQRGIAAGDFNYVTARAVAGAVEVYASSGDGLRVLKVVDTAHIGAPFATSGAETIVYAPEARRFTGLTFAPGAGFEAETTPYPATPPQLYPSSTEVETFAGRTSTLTVDVADPNTPSSELTLTVQSSNATVLPNDNVTVTGTGTRRTVTLRPITNGSSDLILTVAAGSEQTTRTIEVAVFPEPPDPTSHYYSGLVDISAAIDLGGELFLGMSDEANSLALFKKGEDGAAIEGFIAGLPGGEADLEGAVRFGDTIVVTGSHGNNRSGEFRAERRFLAHIRLSGTGEQLQLTGAGSYTRLWDQWRGWDAANGHGLGANFLKFETATRPGVLPNAPNGWNVEGLTMAPGSSTTGWFGMRAPTVTGADGIERAVILPVNNLDQLTSNAVDAQLGRPILLDLGGRSIRDIAKNAQDQYLISAGPGDTSDSLQTWALYTWDGNPDHDPQMVKELATDAQRIGAWEGIAEVPADLGTGSRVLLTADSGDTGLGKAYGQYVTLDAPAARPAVVGGLAATTSAGAIALRWDAAAGATRYYVTAKTADGADAPGTPRLVTGTRTDIGGVPGGTEYTVDVRAENTASRSASATKLKVTPEQGPRTPTTTTLQLVGTPVFGEPYTLVATVSDPDATGTIRFTNNGSTLPDDDLGPDVVDFPVVDGKVTINPGTRVQPGVRNLRADFTSTNPETFLSSSSGSVPTFIAWRPRVPKVEVVSITGDRVAGGQLAIKAKISGYTPAELGSNEAILGFGTRADGATARTVIGNVTAEADGEATLITSALAAGKHRISVDVRRGINPHIAGWSTEIPLEIAPAGSEPARPRPVTIPKVALSVTGTRITNQPHTLTARVSDRSLAGTVQFFQYSGGSIGTPVPVVNGIATRTGTITADLQQVFARFEPADDRDMTASAVSLGVGILRAAGAEPPLGDPTPTTTTLSLDGERVAGEPLTANVEVKTDSTAPVAERDINGYIELLADGTEIAMVPVLRGKATDTFTLPVGSHTLQARYVSSDERRSLSSASAEQPVAVAVQTEAEAPVGGSVPATLALSMGAPASFEPFVPGVEHQYTAQTSAKVISTAGDAALTVSEPGRMTNGAFSLASPLRVELSKTAWTGPVSNESVDIAFKQAIGANDPLRTGTYSKTLTFTLSTTQP
ncbi:DUF3616 domain-containing protein [Solirubrobacter sp. CPCC 204708]|uniref:DUF3616 domain-containing protein n=1 Tax=Solirubrobacter deserti TaxID=2282478 RepID=A0ABT4RUD9_9ACTN|nr:DUF3616 domain-containing protein [Solirubrobacter deserti]MBE2319177.1 DUF3616 domain-containing protein [Solirubrobacter deserti]MDA0142203.1 DUF3616 domain-containing protein [Solirubrobacter deserti]